MAKVKQINGVKQINHYEWLEVNLPLLFENLGLKATNCTPLIQAHGDKCYTSDVLFERNGILFHEGVAMYLLTHVSPYDKEVRATDNGWVDPFQWIVNNKDRFMKHMPK